MSILYKTDYNHRNNKVYITWASLKWKARQIAIFIFRLNQQMPTCNGMMTMTMFIVVPTSLRMVCSWGRAGQGSSSSYFRLEFAFVARNCCVLLLPSQRRTLLYTGVVPASPQYYINDLWHLPPFRAPIGYFPLLCLCYVLVTLSLAIQKGADGARK